GSLFQTNALQYAKILARNGVKLKILPSHGSLENIERLARPGNRVDIGFIQGGITNAVDPDHLVSLGSVSYEPLFVFYRAEKEVRWLSEFDGKKVAIGPVGSGARTLALTLLATNGITPGGPAELLDLDADAAADALLNRQVDAAFFMADSASSRVLRQLLRTPDIHLYDFSQADAYTRRIRYLHKLEMPMGSIDFAKNIPNRSIHLVGPTVELIARTSLHPALSDLLLETAREVHGRATLFQRRGEFPSAMESEFRLSDQAIRYYRSGQTLLYRSLPFWLASLLNRSLLVIVPLVVVLLPALPVLPAIFTWQMRRSINRWYRALLVLEREIALGWNHERHDEFVKRLEEIEQAVNQMKIPASFGDQFYELRGHIHFVRLRLVNTAPKKTG
ncbi:MAG: C4-dicarboxylate ABC transporter substrate-binding protein, partial [Verrucomicrobia bacterium]|nr:C4-dicarboxylate ABC transporter substrate-binding protein [Verrucomicrobiota bacterium]